MKERKIVTIIVLAIAALSFLATCVGIFSHGEYAPSTVKSVRGEEVPLYGKGVYHHMSAAVAPQGIAQDVVTLLIGIPCLIWGLFLFRKGSLRGKILLTGILGYFLTTYMFFTLMAMYNRLFLLWVLILSLCFHVFYMMFSGLKEEVVAAAIKPRFPRRWLGGFLIFCALAIGSLWLSIVVPPALNGSIPVEVEHYTTLVVQALDLAIGLPVAFIAGVFVIKRRTFGFKLASVYIVFLALLMTALSAKLIAMGYLGFSIVPAIFIIPVFNMMSLVLAFGAVQQIKEPVRG